MDSLRIGPRAFRGRDIAKIENWARLEGEGRERERDTYKVHELSTRMGAPLIGGGNGTIVTNCHDLSPSPNILIPPTWELGMFPRCFQSTNAKC